MRREQEEAESEYLSYIVLKAQQGEMQAFGLLYQETIPNVTRFLQSRGYDLEGTIEDVIQETYLIGMENISKLSPRAARSWFCGIARRVASSQRRRQYNKRKVEFLDYETNQDTIEKNIKSTKANPEELCLKREITQEYKEISRTLSERQKSALELKRKGLTDEESAERLGISLGTFKSRLRLAKESCKKNERAEIIKELLSY